MLRFSTAQYPIIEEVKSFRRSLLVDDFLKVDYAAIFKRTSPQLIILVSMAIVFSLAIMVVLCVKCRKTKTTTRI